MYLRVILFIAVVYNTRCFAAETTKSEICSSYLSHLGTGVAAKEEWALDMLDASSKLPAGLRSGNLVDLGSFDQCLAIDNNNGIRGKYCFVTISMQGKTQPDNRAMIAVMAGARGPVLAWCIPDVCDIANITKVIESIIELPVRSLNLCQTKNDVNEGLSTSDWAVVGFFIFILDMMVLSTLYDIYIQYNDQDMTEILFTASFLEPAHLSLVAFSMLTNGKKLLAVSHNPDQLPCLHGLRFISIMWVVLGHSYAGIQYKSLLNFNDIDEWRKSASSMYIQGAPVSVDTFFVLSGLLISYGFLHAKEKGTRFNVLLYYIHRYIRLTPALAVMVLINSTIVDHMGSGPYWPLGTPMRKDICIKWWWSAILYVQNYVNSDETCMGQSWYLSVDTQLYVLAPILLIPLWKWPRYTIYASFILLLGSIASSFAIAWSYEFGGMDANGDFQIMYYQATHARYGPWLMGLMMGYYIFKLKRRRKDPVGLHPSIISASWLVALTTMAAVVFAPINMSHHEYNRWESSIFIGLHRHAWALGICWIIYACTQGYGGPFNSFLSWSPFHVLGRFTYTIYLTHGNAQLITTLNARTNTYFTDLDAVHGFWGDMVFSLFFAICLTLAFESPMLVIEKIIFKPSKKPMLPVHQQESTNVHNFGNTSRTNKAFNQD